MPQNNPFINFIKPNNTLVPAELDVQANQLISAAHAQSYNAAFNQRVFTAASQAGVTTSAALATTYTGLVVSNPVASTKNLSILRVTGLMNVAPAALTGIGLIVGFNAATNVTHTTPGTVMYNFPNAATAPVALVDTAATLPTAPTWYTFLAETPAATSVAPAFNFAAQGELLIPPGGYIAIGTTIAGPTAGIWASIVWEEIAITG
jgi:hypothetical protein